MYQNNIQKPFTATDSMLSATALSEYKSPWNDLNPVERPSTNYLSRHRANQKRMGSEAINM
jgi:hypothetical protein